MRRGSKYSREWLSRQGYPKHGAIHNVNKITQPFPAYLTLIVYTGLLRAHFPWTPEQANSSHLFLNKLTYNLYQFCSLLLTHTQSGRKPFRVFQASALISFTQVNDFFPSNQVIPYLFKIICALRLMKSRTRYLRFSAPRVTPYILILYK